jgi:membrane protein
MRGPHTIRRMKRPPATASAASDTARVVWALLKESGHSWFHDNVPSMGAALTFYALLSLAPVLIVATAVAGLGFSQQAVEAEVLRRIQALVGETSSRALRALILSAHRPAAGALAGTIGIGTMLVGASGAFVELQNSLNKIWRVAPKSGNVLLAAIRQRLLSFGLVLATGIVLLLSPFSTAALGAAERFTGHLLPWSAFSLQWADFVLSFAVITLLLALIFTLLPDTAIAWNDVWIGAATASLLFTIGKLLVGLYLGPSVVSSAYGAASSPLVVLVWIYYSAQILLFGAEITHVYANRHGSRA